MIIVLDAGHGGSDPGAVSPIDGSTEKRINWNAAVHLKERLRCEGHECDIAPHHPTGRTSLSGRVRYAKAHHADLFLSLHCNSNAGTPGTGVEVLYRLQRNKLHAGDLAERLAQGSGLANRGAKLRLTLTVLDGHAATCRAFLVEMGFINNRHDLALLESPNYWEALGDAVVDWIERF
jgi:N-acetylmuramoyl-L-alanine amidase